MKNRAFSKKKPAVFISLSLAFLKRNRRYGSIRSVLGKAVESDYYSGVSFVIQRLFPSVSSDLNTVSIFLRCGIECREWRASNWDSQFELLENNRYTLVSLEFGIHVLNDISAPCDRTPEQSNVICDFV